MDRDSQQKGTIGKFAAKYDIGASKGAELRRVEFGQILVSTPALLLVGSFVCTLELHYDVGGLYRRKAEGEALEVA